MQRDAEPVCRSSSKIGMRKSCQQGSQPSQIHREPSKTMDSMDGVKADRSDVSGAENMEPIGTITCSHDVRGIRMIRIYQDVSKIEMSCQVWSFPIPSQGTSRNRRNNELGTSNLRFVVHLRLCPRDREQRTWHFMASVLSTLK